MLEADKLVPVLIPALSGLIGALLGASASILTATFTLRNQRRLEKERWRREDANRFLTDRRQLYARFLAAADELNDAINAYLAHLASPPQLQQSSPAQLVQDLLRSYKNVYKVGEEIELVGSRVVAEYWLKVHLQARRLTEVESFGGREELEKVRHRLGQGVLQFVRAARQELGIEELSHISR